MDRGEINLYDLVLIMVIFFSLVYIDVLCVNFVGGFIIIVFFSEMLIICY